MNTELTNRQTGLLTQVKTETGITLGNGDGTYDVTMDELKVVESVGHVDVSVTSGDGYVAKAEAVDPGGAGKNVVQITLYESAGSAAALATVADGAGVADIRVTAQGI